MVQFYFKTVSHQEIYRRFRTPPEAKREIDHNICVTISLHAFCFPTMAEAKPSLLAQNMKIFIMIGLNRR